MAQSPTSATERELLAVVQTLADAQRTFDQAAMERVLASDYVEVSPVGEVDLRAKVLGFYTPDQKGKGPVPSVTMRTTAQLRKVAGAWRISSMQYTPILSRVPETRP